MADLEHIPEYFAKPGITKALAEAHPVLLIRQMANEILRLEALRAREGVVVPRDFPNIQAVLDGTTSGHYSEWPALRIELKMLISSKEAECKAMREELKLVTHKVITCGVAASHPNANLSRTGAYIEKWDSPQAQEVRKLRDSADAMREAIGRTLTNGFPLSASTRADLENAIKE